MLTATRRANGDVLISLSDDLGHPAYAWPRSAVHVPLADGAPVADHLLVLDGDGRVVGRIPCQRHEHDLWFLAELPSGSRQTWLLTGREVGAPAAPGPAPARVDLAQRRIVLSNEHLRVEVGADPAARHFRLTDAGGAEQAVADVTGDAVVSRSAAITADGPVFVEARQQTLLASGARLDVRFRLVAGEDSVRVHERLEAADGVAQVRITARQGLTHRVAPNRPTTDPDWRAAALRHAGPLDPAVHSTTDEWEPIGATLRPDGELPFQLRPFHAWSTWWRLPWAGFWSEDSEAPALGVYLDDIRRWRDGSYAVWGSSERLAVRFHVEDDRLVIGLPVRTGERQLSFAVLTTDLGDGAADRGSAVALALADRLRWRSWLPLDTVSRWVLNHREPRETYSRVFHAADHDVPGDRVAMLRDRLLRQQRTLVETPVGGPRSSPGPSPVEARAILGLVAPLFDQLAPDLDEDTFALASASLQFLGYLCLDEMLMPTRTMLAGHPNFLADILSQVALVPVLFPTHPDARAMAEHVEQVIALNLRLHTRPAVPVRGTDAGRWTENLGTYAMAHLAVTVTQSALLRRHFDGRNRLAPAELRQLADWLINTLSVPLDRYEGRRVHPPQGAHSYAGPMPRFIRVLAEELERIDPVLAENLWWCTPATEDEWESADPGTFDHAALLRRGSLDRPGQAPDLRSRAFTGYGVVLRAAAHTPDEMVVILQQIDEGPNYRWGRAARGGNGVLYYAAAGERWSHIGSEHVGDGYYGDVEACSNFGVKAPGGYRDLGEYRSIGRGDLVNPLVALSVAQFAQADAAPDIAPRYRSRSVVMVGHDYLVVLDDVPDPSTPGRFSWFADADGPFPHIDQLRPGVGWTDVVPDPPTHEQRGRYPRTRGRYYDGAGTFLTLVSRRPDLTSIATPWGASVQRPDGTDDVVRSPDPVQHTAAGVSVTAEAAVIRTYSDRVEAALLRGNRLSTEALDVHIEGPAGLDLVQSPGQAPHGTIAVTGDAATLTFRFPSGSGRLHVDGVPQPSSTTADAEVTVLVLPRGQFLWERTRTDATPPAPRITRVVRRRTGADVHVEPVPAATDYLLVDAADPTRVLATSATPTVHLPRTGHVQAIGCRARNGDALSNPSPAHPLPPGDGVLPPPDGLTLTRRDGQVSASWGTVLGASSTRVYRRDNSAHPWRRVAETAGTSITLDGLAPTSELAVTSVDDLSESEHSASVPAHLLDSALGRRLETTRFVRATESHECGYPEYDPWIEGALPFLEYPKH
ncbi:hypothetical protein [Occultella kanbiaonis]|uniref:hypothetical protein n=1 Tax=Occultella kanbiaonis TaxID=2675754 RepID=UPI0012B91072|nr:hypothetical protein [Occultella kanbiaonis]